MAAGCGKVRMWEPPTLTWVGFQPLSRKHIAASRQRCETQARQTRKAHATHLRPKTPHSQQSGPLTRVAACCFGRGLATAGPGRGRAERASRRGRGRRSRLQPRTWMGGRRHSRSAAAGPAAHPALTRSAHGRREEEEKEVEKRRKSRKSRRSRARLSPPEGCALTWSLPPHAAEREGKEQEEEEEAMLQRSSPRPAVPGSPQRRAVLPAPPPPQVGPGPPRSPPAAGRARGAGALAPGPAPPPPRPAPCRGRPRRRCHRAGAAPRCPPRWKTGRAAAAGGSGGPGSSLSRLQLTWTQRSALLAERPLHEEWRGKLS